MTTAQSEDALKALMLLSLDGDEAAYRHLLTGLRVLLIGYYSRRMAAAAKADMEDLVQETLLALHSRRSTYDRERPFTAWFFSIARYKLIDHHRGRGGRRLAETQLGEEIESDFSEDMLTARMDVERLLDGLPLRQRELIRQVKLEGQSVADTANRTGQSESAVKVGIHRALRALAEKMRGAS
ncbi:MULTISPECIES: sigma-70 family RNA polymerase sigma factor [unclassified Rhizobium]|uniref:sigma-70 family RNA polymerase sigma factor n=1 Tax=unclassified Rhizobium TaxID=2613769 RepID=UPI0007EBFB0A|nr:MULTISPECIES: sigma-70 family RNA polymerase sigma factor [unclassified Rhizobium]ANM14921.1 RNA polymerase sigma factor protein [Rhizobium sp. N324]ANM21309.1 RNA polymerase sigma factor protein [Rhizobium sp. N541]ANM27681.1 RNA polymerase sigma factor protein [Rhizobium sp. N941]OYD00025.1 RNA polymerase sigma factor protein [Rhizobium sp. N4311]